MPRFPEPSEKNGFLREHAALLIQSYRHWTGRSLVDATLPPDEQARELFYAPFAVASHNTDPDPLLTYGNRTALGLWEASWAEFASMPSRQTAEAANREERNRLLAEVTAHGFIDHYRGVRISITGRRFMIDQATVWNLINETGDYRGQAAMFHRWRFL